MKQMQPTDFPQCEYGKAAAMRAPIREALNKARMMPAHKMDQVEAILKAALQHIEDFRNEYEPEGDTEEDTVGVYNVPVVDILDSLLGPAKTELDAS
tara:strand:- start:1341 stop:1631 length:291 start_codon:yes stop_codon:yes gene_type:complete